MNKHGDYLQRSEIFKRYPGNPILTPEKWPYRTNAVFNPGAVQHESKTLLLNRVEGMDGLSHFTVARSKDGKTDWTIDSEPTVLPDPESHPEEIWGIEDPRVVRLEELDEYAVTYTSYSREGPLVSMALTKDFRTFRRQGVIMPPENKDASLFPRKFNGRWALLHRPIPVNPAARAHIWLSFSPDLIHWGEHAVVMEAREGGWWDAHKIGLGPQPIETQEGWLIVYHGVRLTASGSIYRAGLALFDLDNPRRVIYRSNEWVFGPRKDYERVGDVSDVTFPSGAVYDAATDELRVYYGAADTSVGLITAKLSDVLDYLKSQPGG